MISSRANIRIASILLTAALFGGTLAAQAPKPVPAPASPGKAIQDAARASVHDLPADRPKDSSAGEVLYGAEGKVGSIEVLSRAQGVDLRPYSQKVVAEIRNTWYRLIPEAARKEKRELTIEFAVLPDGRITAMKLVSPSGNDAVDRAALEAIKAASPFPALPSYFKGPNVRLRFHFLCNPDTR